MCLYFLHILCYSIRAKCSLVLIINYKFIHRFFTFLNLDTLWVYVSTCRSSKTVVVLIFVPIFPTLMSKKFSESCFLFPLSQNAISCIEEYRLRMSRLFSIVGDSNVRRNWTGLNIASREAMKAAQVVYCEDFSSLEASLNQVRAKSNACIIAPVTNFILMSGDSGTISSAVDPLLNSFAKKLTQFCAAGQDLQVRI